MKARKIALFGECMLELQGDAFGALTQGFGGDTLNTAVYLSRCARQCGLIVSYATGLGTDRLSDGLLRRWEDEGLAVDLVRRVPGRMPGLYQIEVDARGERSFHYWRDTSAARAYFDVARTPLEEQADRLDAFYFSGISLAILPEAGRQRLFALLERLRARGAAVVFDNNHRPRLWAHASDARAAHTRAQALASIALVTLDDEQVLHEIPDADEAIRRTLDWSTPEVVIKRGPLPTLVREAGGRLTEAATQPVPQVVDTTAAGDSFAGGYLAVRLAGGSAQQAARMGNRLAARVIQHRGALIPSAAMGDLVLSGTTD